MSVVTLRTQINTKVTQQLKPDFKKSDYLE